MTRPPARRAAAMPSRLRALHHDVFRVAETALADWLVPTLARLVFAAVLLRYFWASAATKIGDGATGFLHPTAGAYAQILPRKAEAMLYDPGQFTAVQKAIVLAGTWAEFLLPLLIVIGLFSRLSALAMIGFVTVQSLTDIHGHMADANAIGHWFDPVPDAVILDQRAFWVFILVVVVLRGGGPISADRWLGLDRREADRT